MVLGWRIRAAIYRFGQALAAHKKGLPVSPFFYPSISRFMPSAFELSDLIAKALAPKPKAKSCPAGGICYQFIRESPNIFKPAEIQHVQTGGHSWEVVYAKQALKDARKLAASGLKPNAQELLAVLGNDPFQNPPPFEKLVGDLAGAYSRRINIQHRIVYEVFAKEKTVRVLRMWTRYE